MVGFHPAVGVLSGVVECGRLFGEVTPGPSKALGNCAHSGTWNQRARKPLKSPS